MGLQAPRRRGTVTLTPRSRVDKDFERRKLAMQLLNAAAGSVRINRSGANEPGLSEQEKLDVAKSKERARSREASKPDQPGTVARDKSKKEKSGKKEGKKTNKRSPKEAQA
eukprot:3453257-Heterocapsa_arctica.AAC.1